MEHPVVNSPMLTGMELKRWGVLCLARVDDRTWGAFEGELIREGKSCGITVHSSGDNYIQSRADSRWGLFHALGFGSTGCGWWSDSWVGLTSI